MVRDRTEVMSGSVVLLLPLLGLVIEQARILYLGTVLSVSYALRADQNSGNGQLTGVSGGFPPTPTAPLWALTVTAAPATKATDCSHIVR